MLHDQSSGVLNALFVWAVVILGEEMGRSACVSKIMSLNYLLECTTVD